MDTLMGNGDKPSVVLLGCDHRIQPIQSDGVRPDQQEFLDLISALSDRHPFDLLAEEWDKPTRTVAQSWANHRRITYLAVDVPMDVKEHIRHPSEQAIFDDQQGEFLPNTEYPEYRRAWRLAREYHMYETINGRGVDCCLLICGRWHLAGFYRLFSHAAEVTMVCFAPKKAECCDRFDI